MFVTKETAELITELVIQASARRRELYLNTDTRYKPKIDNRTDQTIYEETGAYIWAYMGDTNGRT